MKEHKIETNFIIYENENELPGDYAQLLKSAKSALENSYSPYSNFKVGASVLLKNGEIVSGWNIENAAYPMCLCAEPATLAAADSKFPNEGIVAMAISIRNPKQVISEPVAPCGACRQIISERENRQRKPIQIILQGEVGEIYFFENSKGLLPFSFDNTFL